MHLAHPLHSVTACPIMCRRCHLTPPPSEPHPNPKAPVDPTVAARVTRLPAAGGKVVAPFDCRTKEVWSADKAKWCADHLTHPSGRTLLEDATTRRPPPPPPPPVEQAKHPDGDFNCRTKEMWSTEKLQWCIDHASKEPGGGEPSAALPPPPVAQGKDDHPTSAEAPTVVIGNPTPAALVRKPAVLTAQPPAAGAQLPALPEIIAAQLLEAGLSASECSGLAGKEDPAVCGSTHALCSDEKWYARTNPAPRPDNTPFDQWCRRFA